MFVRVDGEKNELRSNRKHPRADRLDKKELYMEVH